MNRDQLSHIYDRLFKLVTSRGMEVNTIMITLKKTTVLNLQK